MFLSCLYVTVGGGTLFLITWFFTGFYGFDRKAFAQTEESVPPPAPAISGEVAPSVNNVPVPAPAISGEVAPSVNNVPVPAPAVPPAPAISGEVAPSVNNVPVPAPAVPPASAIPGEAVPSVNNVPVPAPAVPPAPAIPGEAVPSVNNVPVPAPAVPPAPAIPGEVAPSANAPSPAGTSKFQKSPLPENISSVTLEHTQKSLEDIDKKIAEVYRMLRNYQYDPDKRRNPFSSPAAFKKKKAGKLGFPSYPTGKYELSKIKLIGIKWGGRMNTGKALFKTPDNIVHTLQKNDRIGVDRGIVYQLREDEVVILQPKAIASINANSEDLFIPIVIRMDRISSKKL